MQYNTVSVAEEVQVAQEEGLAEEGDEDMVEEGAELAEEEGVAEEQ